MSLESRTADGWATTRFVVLGFGTAGYACADSLIQAGAEHVVVLDDRDNEALREKARILETLGATITLGPGSTAELPKEVDVVVTSPGVPPHAPLLAQAAERDVPIWSEIELAWRLRDPANAAPWLCITGTNGKTTTVQMLTAILQAAGHRAVAAGNVGLPLLEAVLDPEPYDVIAVELSSYQLHFTHSMSAHSAAVLNLAPDHVDWHGSMAAYALDKGRIYANCQVACVYNVADPATEQLVADADVVEGCRAIGFTLGTPGLSMIGLVDDLIVDRAFIEERATSAQELASLADITPAAPHNVANALAAAALARSFGVPATAVRDGLRGFRPDKHRIAHVAEVAGVNYVDDSKATNPHAAQASLLAYEHVVWIAGGQAKGATFDELVIAARDRLRAVVLLGQDKQVIIEALERHAPDVPRIVVDATDTGAMRIVVGEAAKLARVGDTVLLAPGCASWDMFANYGARGDAFAEAVRSLAE
ncbi:UDP-N-acetylmuramoyl-L-alanine--D-glutamate ligase [Kribbella solani]|uniref:UDP-N-acetylmuramoyl-L-alanine--D-glutamate ligase n=1 Tax=Kribbella solani TaxID=236067 RepID=UPI0029A82633|nr:UDP-N-acetylmuramoyl-L-alanine--D-glutamate ligase [Kribbella solani]MDX2970952.1 UDP-N-acetylmuramoyl-L-alanine--D-glutamate ligase [Kribbella solani]MDX3000249.1 UDP-N-acetylmuramoyl-L-alanine--D-glutamate ligase [Kribbella solani]